MYGGRGRRRSRLVDREDGTDLAGKGSNRLSSKGIIEPNGENLLGWRQEVEGLVVDSCAFALVDDLDSEFQLGWGEGVERVRVGHDMILGWWKKSLDKEERGE